MRASLSAVGCRCGSTESARSTAASNGFGRSGREPARDGAPSPIARALSSTEAFQNGWMPASASQSSTPTDQTSLAAVAGRPARRSGEMYASVPHVSDGRQRVGLVHLGQSEVEEADGDRVPLGEQDVRRLDVAVDDAARVRVREPLADLRGGLDGGRVVDGPSRSASRSVRPGTYS